MMKTKKIHKNMYFNLILFLAMIFFMQRIHCFGEGPLDESFNYLQLPVPQNVALLIVSSLGKLESSDYVMQMHSYKDSLVKFILNCYEEDPEICDNLDVLLHENQVERLVVQKTRIPKAKTYIWKHIVTPEVVSKFDYIWLLDPVVIFDLNEFPVTKILSIARSVNSTILSPSILEFHHAIKHISHKEKSPEVEVSCLVDSIGPIYSSLAYSHLYNDGLRNINDDLLEHSQSSISPYNCDLMVKLNLNPCLHVSSYPLRRRTNATTDDVKPFDREWEILRETQNISHVCMKNKESNYLVKKWIHEHYEMKRAIPIMSLGIFEDHGLPSSYASLMKFKQRASEIYDLHRMQNISIVENLQKKWKDVILYKDVDPFDLFLEMGRVIDITDNTVLSTSQYFHGLQAYYNMKAMNITDKRALFLGLFHDVGKLLTLFGEKPENVVCSTFTVQEPKYPSELCTHPTISHLPLVTSWNHDTIAATRLAPYLSKELLFVFQFHSFSPLLRGNIHCQLTNEEKSYLPLLRTLWRYDHLYKDLFIDTDLMFRAKQDEAEIRSVLYEFLPRKMNF